VRATEPAKSRWLLRAASYDTIQGIGFYHLWMSMPRRKHAWEKLSDEQLLKQRLSSLRVKVGGTWLEDCLGTLNEEVHARDLLKDGTLKRSA
jgi:hypothetical protein